MSQSWKIKLNVLPILTVFFYRNLISFSEEHIERLMDVVLHCLGDENVGVREMAAKTLSGLLRCSQRQKILPLKASDVYVRRSMYLIIGGVHSIESLRGTSAANQIA